MANEKSFVLGEKIQKENLSSGAEAKYSPDQIEGLNFEKQESLKENGIYLILPQSNCGVKYKIPNVGERWSKRLFIIEVGENNKLADVRTVGVSRLRAMYVADAVEGATPPECADLERRPSPAGPLRLKRGAVDWKFACADTSWIKGDEATQRAIVTKPVLIKVTGVRKPVFVFQYENKPDGQPGGDIKTVTRDGQQVAVCGIDKRFMKFEVLDQAPAKALVTAGEKIMDAIRQEFGLDI